MYSHEYKKKHSLADALHELRSCGGWSGAESVCMIDSKGILHCVCHRRDKLAAQLRHNSFIQLNSIKEENKLFADCTHTLLFCSLAVFCASFHSPFKFNFPSDLLKFK